MTRRRLASVLDGISVLFALGAIAILIEGLTSGDQLPSRLFFPVMVLATVCASAHDYMLSARHWRMRMRDHLYFIATFSAVGIIFEFAR